jgi:hypothetical protein
LRNGGNFYVEGESEVPSGITPFAATGGRWNMIELPERIVDVPLADQMPAFRECDRVKSFEAIRLWAHLTFVGGAGREPAPDCTQQSAKLLALIGRLESQRR